MTSKEIGYSWEKEIGNVLYDIGQKTTTIDEFLIELENFLSSDNNKIFIIIDKTGKWKDMQYSTIGKLLSKEEYDKLSIEIMRMGDKYKYKTYLYAGTDEWLLQSEWMKMALKRAWDYKEEIDFC